MKILICSLLIFTFLYILSVPLFVFAQEDYKVGPGDVLDITVWNEPNLTKVITITKQGNINLPLLGELSVDGLSCRQIEKLIADRLKEGGYILSPKVNVLVKEYKSKKVMIFGLTNKPGIHYLRGKTNVLELISDAGITQNAGTMLIHRGALAKKISQKPLAETIKNKTNREDDNLLTVDLQALLAAGDLSQNIEIKPGDIIYVATGTKHRIYILGEVKNPGPYSITKGLTLLSALKQAGGLTQFAAPNKIKILRERGEGSKKETIRIRMKDIQRGDKSKDIELKPGDVIVVPQSWF